MKMPNTFNFVRSNLISQIKSPVTDSKKEIFLLPLSVNEVVEADVLEKVGDRKLLILLKTAKILADSEIPFKVGEKITVKVERLHPRVVLRFIQNPEKLQDSGIADYVRFYRSNPKAVCAFFFGAKQGVQSRGPGGGRITSGKGEHREYSKPFRIFSDF